MLILPCQCLAGSEDATFVGASKIHSRLELIFHVAITIILLHLGRVLLRRLALDADVAGPY